MLHNLYICENINSVFLCLGVFSPYVLHVGG